MSRSIESTGEVHADVDAAADLDAAPVEAPASDVDADEEVAPGTLYERMKHLIGVVSSDCTDGSERVSEYFAEGMLQKHREGRL